MVMQATTIHMARGCVVTVGNTCSHMLFMMLCSFIIKGGFLTAPIMQSGRKRLRQASEAHGECAVLCYACRRTPDTTKQQGLASFFVAAGHKTEGEEESGSSSAPSSSTQCSRCLRVLEQPTANRSGSSSKSRALPQIVRIRSYERLAKEQGVPFAVSESAAAALMRLPCITCGAASPTEGHGLTRLRMWPAGLSRPARGGFMGPFHPENLATACSMCNLMKGFRTVRAFVEACRHIATHRTGSDFGTYPHRFRNNVSKRSRSSYISASSTHTKTHALSNEAFNAIVSGPCHYCGKASDPPHHHNGLDRLDSAVRVYTADSCVSSCGDCNVMKYVHSEAAFLAHVHTVASHHIGVDTWPGDGLHAEVDGLHAEADGLHAEADGLHAEGDAEADEDPGPWTLDPEDEDGDGADNVHMLTGAEGKVEPEERFNPFSAFAFQD